MGFFDNTYKIAVVLIALGVVLAGIEGEGGGGKKEMELARFYLFVACVGLIFAARAAISEWTVYLFAASILLYAVPMYVEAFTGKKIAGKYVAPAGLVFMFLGWIGLGFLDR